ncbi:hypothetical protein HDU93_000103 [Gonapodya sp. JEL0774]|nr:hypothetical protein HDU93_000103 [Gonapodya sp. JEL0774]
MSSSESEVSEKDEEELSVSQPLTGQWSNLAIEELEGSFIPERGRPMVTKWLIAMLVAGTLGAVSYLIVSSIVGRTGLDAPEVEISMLNITKSGPIRAHFNVSEYLATGSATFTVQENLVRSRKYITSFPSSGWTNQVMEVTNLIYLARLTDRIPIVPSFEPTHFGSLNTAGPLKFEDVFDVPYLMGKLGFPVVQWHEIKELNSSSKEQPLEQIGCWSVRAGNQASGGVPGDWTSKNMFKLDVSYTPVPYWFTLTHGADLNTRTWSLWALASLSFPEMRARILGEQSWATLPVPSGSGKKLEPNDHLLCFDDVYYTGLIYPNPGDDFFNDYSPMWNHIGVHMRWKSTLVDIANQYLRKHFGVQEDDSIPPFISVHVRRDDFKMACSKDITLDQCFASLKSFRHRVQDLQKALLSRPEKINVTEVIVTSDERDPRWWEQVAELGPGWRWINHTVERTEERYGKWYPLVLDVVFQSMGAGFVGTRGSTMSNIAAKRVQDWHGGPSFEVAWGHPDADEQ